MDAACALMSLGSIPSAAIIRYGGFLSTESNTEAMPGGLPDALTLLYCAGCALGVCILVQGHEYVGLGRVHWSLSDWNILRRRMTLRTA